MGYQLEGHAVQFPKTQVENIYLRSLCHYRAGNTFYNVYSFWIAIEKVSFDSKRSNQRDQFKENKWSSKLNAIKCFENHFPIQIQLVKNLTPLAGCIHSPFFTENIFLISINSISEIL